jgi:hypothetical protein
MWLDERGERERCFRETKVAGSPPGGDRRPGGWLLARPVAVAVSPHCWSWFIPFSTSKNNVDSASWHDHGRCMVFSPTDSWSRCKKLSCIWNTDKLDRSSGYLSQDWLTTVLQAGIRISAGNILISSSFYLDQLRCSLDLLQWHRPFHWG